MGYAGGRGRVTIGARRNLIRGVEKGTQDFSCVALTILLSVGEMVVVLVLQIPALLAASR